VTVREFLRTIWDGKWYVLTAIVIVMVAALIYLQRQVTTYEATASVQLNSATSATSSSADVTATTANADPSIVTSRAVGEVAAKELGVDPAGAPYLALDVTATFGPDTSTMSIVAHGTDAARTAATANAFATAYAAHLPDVIDTQVAAIDKRLDALKAQLADATDALKKDAKDPVAAATRTSANKQIAALADQQVTLRSISPPGQVTARATGASPEGANRTTVLALSLLAGLVAGIGLAFARRAVDFHVRTVAQAAEITEAPVLAEIDGVKQALKEAAHHGRLPVASRVATPYTESIRELRTAVQVGVATKPHAAVVVTASDPSAPRSFIAANLAASWALSGRRTIAFSADMRRPELDGILPAPEGWSGDARALRPTRVPNLSLYPVPDQPLDPADFLATRQARQLVESLRAQADIVVIDAPPVLAAADATILGSYSDGVVLVASVGRTDQAVLAEAANRLRVNSVPLTGLAVAGVTGDRRMAYAATYGEAAPAASSGPASAPTATPVDATTASPVSTRAERRSTIPQREAPVQPTATVQPTPVHAAAAPPAVPAHAVPATTGAVRTAAPTLRQGRPRIQPAWSPVQNRPRTGAIAVVDDTTAGDRPATPPDAR